MTNLLDHNVRNGKYDDVSMKTLDVWENDHLLHFLEHSKHLPGTTKKQIKYLARKAMHYVLDKFSLYFSLFFNC